jgi:Protein of unknown function (DUF3616)
MMKATVFFLSIMLLFTNLSVKADISWTPVIVDGPFRNDDGDVATDISGIACASLIEGKRTCLLINDEDRSAQFATLAASSLTATIRVPLIEKATEKTAYGTAPSSADCSGGAAGFKDLDGEAVAYAEPFFYVVGSHGCSRKKAKFHKSSFLLLRVEVDRTGVVAQPPQATFRLSQVLSSGELESYFGKDLDADTAGLNVEGLAVIGAKTVRHIFRRYPTSVV